MFKSIILEYRSSVRRINLYPSPCPFSVGKSYTESEYQAVLATIPPLERLWAPKADLPSFTTVMGFNGSPEIINGRLAMMGFVAAVGAELSSGECSFPMNEHNV